MSSTHPSLQANSEHEVERVPLPNEDAEQILRLLCEGAIYEHGIHLRCCTFDTDGSARELALADHEGQPNKFCCQARKSAKAGDICRTWYQQVAQAYTKARQQPSPKVMECPFGLTVLMTPVEWGELVRLVLFGGCWSESGSEGVIYFRVEQAEIPEEEKQTLTDLIPGVPDMVCEEMGSHKKTLLSVVGDLTRLLGLMYSQQKAAREYDLTKIIQEFGDGSHTKNLEDTRLIQRSILKKIAEKLGVQFVVLFANLGTPDRLNAWAWGGLTDKLAEGLYLKGYPWELVREVESWQEWDNDERSKWVRSHLAKAESPQGATLRGVHNIHKMLPIELGASFCGILVFGQPTKKQKSGEPMLTNDDHHGLTLVAHKLLRNGLRDIVERQEVSDILLRTAHILRGPLTGIQGELEFLEERLETGVVNETELRQIHTAIQEQIHNIESQAELMEESQRIGGKELGEPKFWGASLASVINQVCLGMARIAEKRSIKFGELNAVRNLPNVEFDWNQIRVVFANLLHNACKYAHSHTTIEFLGEKTIRAGKPGVRVSVVDFGTGIRPAELNEAIFRPGFRGTVRDEKRNVEGAGVGLAVCKEIVKEVHHGRINASCEESTGKKAETYQYCRVEFSVELPLQQPEAIGRSN